MPTQVSDLQIHDQFMSYVQEISMETDSLVASGAVTRNATLDTLLAGGGKMIDMPFFKDLSDETENISNDVEGDSGSYGKITSGQDVAVALRRNYGWSAMDLAAELSNEDPMGAIARRTADYWRGRRLAALKALVQGVLAANDKTGSPGGGTGAAGSGDLTFNATGIYSAGVTDLNTDTLADGLNLMGEYQELPGGVMYVHPNVYTNLKKTDVITFEQPSAQLQRIAFYGNLRVVQSNALPVSGNDYETWILPGGAIQLGLGVPQNPIELERKPAGGNGAGQDILWQRLTYALHLPGYAWNVTHATTPVGGPSNAATANNLAHADSWIRVASEREMIPFVRIMTTEA